MCRDAWKGKLSFWDSWLLLAIACLAGSVGIAAVAFLATTWFWLGAAAVLPYALLYLVAVAASGAFDF